MKKKKGQKRAFGKYLFRWLLVLVLGFAAISVAFNIYIYQTEKDHYTNLNKKEKKDRIEYLARNMNESFTKLKRMSEMVIGDDVVLELYCKYDMVNSFERGKLFDAIKERCMELDNMNELTLSSTLYFPDKNLKIDRFGYHDDDSEEFRQFITERQTGKVFLVTDDRAYMVEVLKKDYIEDYWEQGNVLGVFVMEVDTKRIMKELNFAKMSPQDILLMTNMDCSELYFTDGTEKLPPLTELQDSRNMAIGDNQYFVDSYEEEGSFFRIYYLQNQSLLQLLQKNMKNSILVFIGISILNIVLVMLLGFRYILHPLEVLLVKAFGEIEKSNLSYRIPLTNKDGVFSDLYRKFNYMAERIDSLVSKELKQQILVNKANFKHLQAQINPHFMYNSYFLLYRMIKSGDRESSLYLCENLGHFFKYINRDSGDDKRLSDEVSHARAYAVIQGYRYRGLISIDFQELPEKYNYIMVPRLVIQPLLENVFKYVIDEMDDDEKIILRVGYHEEGEHLVISVENSGNIHEEELCRIRQKLQEPEKEENITALVNINLRLNAYFKEDQSVRVLKSNLGGLKVEIRVRL